MKIVTTLLFALASIFAAVNATGQSMTSQAEAEWEQVKRTTYVWTCTCVAGREVWAYKSLAQMESESLSRSAKEKNVLEKLAQQATLSSDPATIQYLATALANICK